MKLPIELDEIDLWNREDAEDLDRPTTPSSYQITVSSRDWTVETIVRQVEQGNIDLDPAFQRRNAWKDHRRSRLIESFILRFPVPQIVLAENPHNKGTFVVIDGKQRLMTVAGLYLPDFRSYWTEPKLAGLKVLQDLNGVSLDDFLSGAAHAQHRRQLGNADIRTTVITGFDDEAVLYDIFYRINTGSVPLSSQELRQVLNRGEFSKYLLSITSSTNALWHLLKIDEPDPRLRDVELLLRLVALRHFAKNYRGNLKAFLDSAMQTLNRRWHAERGNIETSIAELLKAVEASGRVYGAHVGRKFKGGRFEPQLNRALFEVQAFFLADPKVRAAAVAKKTAIAAQSKELFADSDFLSSIETTTKSLANYRARFTKYHRMLEKTLGITIAPLQLPEAK